MNTRSQVRAKARLMEKGYKKLLVWQKADDLALRIYKATKDFPREETYGLTSQLRRAAISVPTNIVEGCGRQGRKELKHFANIAMGSLAETEYLLELSCRLAYLSVEEHKEIETMRAYVGALLWRFYSSL